MVISCKSEQNFVGEYIGLSGSETVQLKKFTNDKEV